METRDANETDRERERKQAGNTPEWILIYKWVQVSVCNFDLFYSQYFPQKFVDSLLSSHCRLSSIKYDKLDASNESSMEKRLTKQRCWT